MECIVNYSEYLKYTGDRIRNLLEFGNSFDDSYSLDKLMDINESWFDNLEAGNYDNCPASPVFAANSFGLETGRYLSVFAYQILSSMENALMGNWEIIEKYESIWNNLKDRSADEAPGILREFWRKPYKDIYKHMLHRMLDPSWTVLRDIAMTAKRDDQSCMYRYGMKIGRVQKETFEFMFTLSEKELRDISETFAGAYLEGLEEAHKNRDPYRTVSVSLPIGYERLVPFLEKAFLDRKLTTLFTRMIRPPVNRQAGYDHRFINSLYLTEDSMNATMSIRRKTFEELKTVLDKFSGNTAVILFGEQPFSPVLRPESPKPDENITVLYGKMMNLSTALRNEFIPRNQCSFCIMSFPSPEIKGDFKAIFRDTMKVNTLSNSRYREIQKTIIDALDGADHAEITGAQDNDTHLRVAIHPIENPDRETAFENCVSSVNIPLGEVFTSPVLKGTNGILHVEESYLKGLRYDNIRLVFRDGYLTEWSCSNFEDPEKCEKYIFENLIYPHKTLPMGEFAIGTNTLAYAMAVRHDIMALLPVLILEKMGPHFAIGDTCYCHQEDAEHFDILTGKKQVAVENEKSSLRHTDPDKAYTHTHTDITLPYTSLDRVTAVYSSRKRIDILRGGRFVLTGTEMLNEPLEEILVKPDNQ